MSHIGLPRPLVVEVEEKDVTPEKLARKKFPGKLAQDPYVGDFDSGTSKCIFDIKHPFMSDIDEFNPLSILAQEFVEFVEDGMNMTRRPNTLYRDGKNDLPEDFVFGSCHINKKDWFEALAHSGRPLKDTHLDVIFYYLRKKAKYGPNLAVKFTTTDFYFNKKLYLLYMEFEEKGQDFSVIPKEHEVEEYIRGCCCDANVAWHKVDHVLFPKYVDRGKSKLGHWVFGCLYLQ
ncbi:uncharacterized protein LOC132057687 [Lycium ferocissimum]|uniref:uncharacterized protein LOC132057687 n=1 Tax=Lycium ferocissimum TaxID=112874 RepID=UPI002814E403|nr:uncharacterized protein LOC132057687 [Lycium ferocissimum]XP_059306292.1 uncharacterized protein LOC132057687 [Lycium ferocissimum]